MRIKNTVLSIKDAGGGCQVEGREKGSDASITQGYCQSYSGKYSRTIFTDLAISLEAQRHIYKGKYSLTIFTLLAMSL